MPEAALAIAPSPSVTISTPAADAIRWSRVVAVALVLGVTFFTIEHSPAEFAGVEQEGQREDRIKDDYIDKLEQGDSGRKLAMFGFGMFGLAALANCRERAWNPHRIGLGLLVLLLMWMALSVVSSDYPSLTIRRLSAMGLLLTGAAGVARMLRPNEMLAVALLSFGGLVGYALFLDVLAGGRPWSLDYRFAGTLHPNIQAAYCGVLCIAAFTMPVPFGRQWVTRAVLLVGLVLLYQTQSRTAAMAALVGLVMAFLVRLRPGVRWGAAATLVALAATGTMVTASLSDGGKAELRNTVLMGRTEKASTLTGRVPLWEQLSEFAGRRPFAGYGYESFWTPKRIDEVMETQRWAIQSAHNAYFEVQLQLGIVGLALILPLILVGMSLMQDAHARTGLAGYAFAYGVFSLALTISLLESHFVKMKYPSVLAVTLLMSVLLFRPRDDEESAAETRFATS